MPRRSVTVCSAYGCRRKRPFTFTHHDIATLTTLVSASRIHRPLPRRSPGIENRVGRETRTWRDRAGIDFSAAGDPTQWPASARRRIRQVIDPYSLPTAFATITRSCSRWPKTARRRQTEFPTHPDKPWLRLDLPPQVR